MPKSIARKVIRIGVCFVHAATAGTTDSGSVNDSNTCVAMFHKKIVRISLRKPSHVFGMEPPTHHSRCMDKLFLQLAGPRPALFFYPPGEGSGQQFRYGSCHDQHIGSHIALLLGRSFTPPPVVSMILQARRLLTQGSFRDCCRVQIGQTFLQCCVHFKS